MSNWFQIEDVINNQLAILNESYIRTNKKRFIATICGSYRRGLPTSGDIDVLLTHPDYTSERLKQNQGNTLAEDTELFAYYNLKLIVDDNPFSLET